MAERSAGRFLDVLPGGADAVKSEVWDPSTVMQDLRLPDAERTTIEGTLTQAGLSISEVTVKHPYSQVDHTLTKVEGLKRPLYLINVDSRVIDKATQANVDAIGRISYLIKGPADVRIFTGPTPPHVSFKQMVTGWRDKGLLAKFAVGRELVDFNTARGDLSMLWMALGFDEAPDVVSTTSVAPPADAPVEAQGGVPPAADGPRIFVSYSHKDEAVFDRLNVHLKGLVHTDEDIDIWTDNRIAAGDDWRAEIADALQSTNILVLLVSADFLASEFIKDEELPLLDDAKARGVKVFWLLAGYASVPTKIDRYHALHYDTPLGTMDENEMDQALAAAMTKMSEYLENDD